MVLYSSRHTGSLETSSGGRSAHLSGARFGPRAHVPGIDCFRRKCVPLLSAPAHNARDDDDQDEENSHDADDGGDECSLAIKHPSVI